MDSLLSPDQLAAIHDALRRGKKIEAIKLYIEATGVELKEAKDAVETMKVGSPPPLPSPAAALATVHEALLRGDKIEAIKLYREATGVGLKEAKDAVEAMGTPAIPALPAISPKKAPPGIPVSTPFPEKRTPLPGWDVVPERKKGCFAMVAAFAGIATVAAVLWG